MRKKRRTKKKRRIFSTPNAGALLFFVIKKWRKGLGRLDIYVLPFRPLVIHRTVTTLEVAVLQDVFPICMTYRSRMRKGHGA